MTPLRKHLRRYFLMLQEPFYAQQESRFPLTAEKTLSVSSQQEMRFVQLK